MKLPLFALFAASGLASLAQAQPQTPPPEPPPEAAPPSPPEAAPPPLTTGDKGSGEISLDEWNRDDWMLVQPKVSLFEVDGYFRLRADTLQRLDFGNGTQTDPGRYQNADDGQANFTGTNMRLRVTPQINVTDDIHIITTVDIFDNLVLGSTPRAPRMSGSAPLNLLADGQDVPKRGVNALTDSIVVKRAYARLTALNEQLELRFGRMPDSFGLGLVANPGDCLDCSYGDVVDRIALTFKAADHLFTPMFDWTSSGPLATPFGDRTGQALDAVPWDDAETYGLRIERIDAPQDVREQTLQGKTVLNYGLWASLARQYRDLNAAYATQANLAPNTPVPVTGGSERRDADIFSGDLYLKLYVGEITLGFEAAGTYGVFKDSYIDPTQLDKTTVFQLGGAFEAAWRLTGDYAGTTLSLRAGGASGDPRPGFGALDAAPSQRAPGDLRLDAFQFDPDYQIDLLLFRNIIGTVTDAWYVKPEVSYVFDNNIGGRLGAIYSQALFRRSTPSSQSDPEEPGKKQGALPMGLEVDAELSYGLDANPEGGAFRGAINGGILFPFAAFNNPTLDEKSESGSFAWTVQARLYLTF